MECEDVLGVQWGCSCAPRQVERSVKKRFEISIQGIETTRCKGGRSADKIWTPCTAALPVRSLFEGLQNVPECSCNVKSLGIAPFVFQLQNNINRC